MLRRLETGRLVLWLVASEPLQLHLRLQPEGEASVSLAVEGDACRQLRVGTSAWLHLIDVRLDTPLPVDRLIEYDLLIEREGGEQGIADWAPHLIHEGFERPAFVVRSRYDDLLHGSCRQAAPRLGGWVGYRRFIGRPGPPITRALARRAVDDRRPDLCR